ncbi:unnamed protein product [Anisakis simplex]|uniref:Uncharacterized protein n=1 Tax=Anisakis simplex TaxID=6269 RepID=A0A0M3J6V4_ANISI|nr:unnamed protein product [Anisakis simplex]
MGRSVFSPMKEAEEMRPVINRHTSATPSEGIGGDNLGGSRVTTPFEDIIPQSRISTTFEANQQQQQFGQQPTTYPQTRFADALFSPSRSRSQFRFAQNFSKIPIGQNYTYNRYSDNRDHQPTKRRSHTTEPRGDNLVQSISRKWPPASNASGVEFTKDNWNVAPSTTTSCRSKHEFSSVQ